MRTIRMADIADEILIESFINQSDVRWTITDDINEADSQVDGINILGRVVGPFFVVDGNSLNGRHYTRGLWEKVITDTSLTMAAGSMFGTIGHEQPIDDKAFLEGKVSHRITKLWIDESSKLGMGEALILNTTAGRNLNSYLRGGSKLPVSSRGFGRYSEKRVGENRVIDPGTFRLEGFDFVLNPGVPSSVPRLVENLNSDEIEDLSMNYEKMLEEKSTEVVKLRETNDSLKDEVNSLKIDAKLQGHDLATAKSSLSSATSESSRTSAKLAEFERLGVSVATLKAIVEDHSQYSKLGSTKELSLVLSKVQIANEQIKALKIDLDKARISESDRRVSESSSLAVITNEDAESLAAYQRLGSIDELGNILDVVESMQPAAQYAEAYKNLGTPAELVKALDIAEEYLVLGTPSEISAVMTIAEQYLALGNPTDINKALDLTQLLIQNKIQEEKRVKATAISTDFSVDLKVVESLLDKMSEEEAISTLTSLAPRKRTRSVGDNYIAESRSRKSSKEEKIVESTSYLSDDSGSRVSRMFEQFNR